MTSLDKRGSGQVGVDAVVVGRAVAFLLLDDERDDDTDTGEQQPAADADTDDVACECANEHTADTQFINNSPTMHCAHIIHCPTMHLPAACRLTLNKTHTKLNGHCRLTVVGFLVLMNLALLSPVAGDHRRRRLDKLIVRTQTLSVDRAACKYQYMYM